VRTLVFSIALLAFVPVFFAGGTNLCSAQSGVTSGQVLDTANRPVPQVPVVAVLGGRVVTDSVTDATGTFRFYNLATGQYTFYPLNRPAQAARAHVSLGRDQHIGVIHLR
jgi:hypothetical protein